jgi:hypothetical protein
MSDESTTPSRPDFFVSVHIPKTGGTTLGQVLNQAFSYRVLMDYAPFDAYATSDPRIRAGRDFITSFFRGIHGHCNVKRHLGLFPDAQYISCVRHPVDRIISQYLHELNENSQEALFHKDIVEGRMSVVDFAAIPGVGDAMSLHLEGLPIEKYDLILITEALPASLRLLQVKMKDLNLTRHFGSPIQLPVINSHKQRKKNIEFDEKTRSEIYLRAPLDVEIYRKATEIFKEQARVHLS